MVDRLFAAAPAAGCWLLESHVPRAWVDLNRDRRELDAGMFEGPPPEDLDLLADSARVAAGLGVIPRIVSEGVEINPGPLTWEQARWRIRQGYEPYHAALAGLIARLRRRFGQVVLIDCHSMPVSAARAMTPLAGRRPQIILGDCEGESCSPLLTGVLEEMFTRSGLRVSRNRVYSGGYITRHYGACGMGVHAIQIEINRELYMDEKELVPHDGFAELRRIISGVIGALPARLSPLWGGLPAAAE